MNKFTHRKGQIHLRRDRGRLDIEYFRLSWTGIFGQLTTPYENISILMFTYPHDLTARPRKITQNAESLIKIRII